MGLKSGNTKIKLIEQKINSIGAGHFLKYLVYIFKCRLWRHRTTCDAEISRLTLDGVKEYKYKKFDWSNEK